MCKATLGGQPGLQDHLGSVWACLIHKIKRTERTGTCGGCVGGADYRREMEGAWLHRPDQKAGELAAGVVNH